MKSWNYSWTVMVLCFVDFIAWYLNIAIIAPLLPLIIEELKLSYLQAGLVSTTVMLAYCLLQYPLGSLADRFGRRNIIVFGQAWSAVVCFLIGMVKDYTQFLILLAILGVGNGMHFTPIAALISDYFLPRNRSKALTISFSGQAVSMLVAPLIALPLSFAYGWRAPYLVTAVFEVGVAIVFALTVREPKRESLGAAKFSGKGLFRADVIKLAFASHFIGYTLAVVNFIPLFLNRKLGIGSYEAGIIYMSIPIALVASSLGTLSSAIIDRLKAKMAVIASGVLASATTASIGLAFSVQTMIAALASYGIMRSIMTPAILNYATEVTQSKNRAAEMGFINTFWIMGSVIGPSIIGFLTDLSSFDMAFLTMSIVPLVSIVITMTLPKNDEEKR